MEVLNFLLPFHEIPLTISKIFKTDFILPLVFFITIWGVFFYTIFQVYRTAKPENWEHNWFGGNKNDKSKKLDAEHGSVMEISEAVATPSEKFADIMPGMILIIGLLGTFLGLGLALDKASSILNGANTLNNIDASMIELTGMMKDLGTKFKTSTWGLLAFILLKMILSKNGYEERRLRWSIEKVKCELDVVRDQKLQEERNNNNKLIECMQSIAAQFEKTVEKNQSANQDQLQLLTNHSQETIKAIQFSHHEQLKQLNFSNEENVRSLASQSELIQKLIVNTQQNQSSQLDTLSQQSALMESKFDVLAQQSGTLIQLIEDQHKETAQLLQENIAQSAQTRNAMVDFINKNEETVVKLGHAAEGMSQAASTMGNSASKLQTVIDSFRKNMEEVISLMKKDLNSTISNMNTSFSQNMTKMSGNLKTSIGDMSTSFKKNMSDMSQGLSSATSDISNAVNSLSTSVDKTMNDVTNTIGKSMELQYKSSTQFTVMSNSLIEKVEGMTGLVNKLSGDITGGLKAVSESNRQVIGLGKQLSRLTETVEGTFAESLLSISSVTSLKPTLDNLASSIQLQKEVLQKYESNNSQFNRSKNSNGNNKNKKINNSIANRLLGFNGAENEG